jgi:hypothetical protein
LLFIAMLLFFCFAAAQAEGGKTKQGERSKKCNPSPCFFLLLI